VLLKKQTLAHASDGVRDGWASNGGLAGLAPNRTEWAGSQPVTDSARAGVAAALPGDGLTPIRAPTLAPLSFPSAVSAVRRRYGSSVSVAVQIRQGWNVEWRGRHCCSINRATVGTWLHPSSDFWPVMRCHSPNGRKRDGSFRSLCHAPHSPTEDPVTAHGSRRSEDSRGSSR